MVASVGEWLRYKSYLKLYSKTKEKNISDKKELPNIPRQKHTIITTRQRTKWVWIKDINQKKVKSIPLQWEKRNLSILPKNWEMGKIPRKNKETKGKFEVGGGIKMWNKVRSRVIGKEWWGNIPRLSATYMTL